VQHVSSIRTVPYGAKSTPASLLLRMHCCLISAQTINRWNYQPKFFQQQNSAEQQLDEGQRLATGT
jgi:hypothetical protein